jgi:hypothetical protein
MRSMGKRRKRWLCDNLIPRPRNKILGWSMPCTFRQSSMPVSDAVVVVVVIQLQQTRISNRTLLPWPKGLKGVLQIGVINARTRDSHLTRSVFEKIFSIGTSWILHQAAVMLRSWASEEFQYSVHMGRTEGPGN